jgi:hypothetical protein
LFPFLVATSLFRPYTDTKWFEKEKTMHYFRQHLSTVAFTTGDVTGDKVPDSISLVGERTADSPFIQHLRLFVKDGRTGKVVSVPLTEDAGYGPSLFIGDVTGDKIADILVSIDSGGSGGMMYHNLYSFANLTPRLIFDSNVYNDYYKYKVTYKNDKKVEVISKRNQKKYIIDISTRDKQYLDEIYNSDGTLKEPISGFVNPISGLYPVDFDRDGVYELLAYQRIAGRYNADALGYVLNTLKWRNQTFFLQDQQVAIFGS